jgi:hypothetical protein
MTGAALPLLPFWHKESVVLVSAQDALRLCRDGGHQALPWGQGRGLVEGGIDDRAGLGYSCDVKVADQYAGRHLKFNREHDKPSSP